ncbi:MAG: ABC-F family ATP-binding cassette domain-containing protein [Dysgonamonadaceae bacterium]|jgi:ATP-binding cassette subfamily F protein uup|nr:ABC-F family ATP-binding cassette domain-containing protein [Dysgonamonadaceae bacterium]
MTPFLQVNKLAKSFGDLLLFADLSFGIADGQRLGLIAKNGSGKTTLLNILAGKEDYDSGEIVFRKDLKTGYLEQNPVFPAGTTVLQTCEGAGNELLAKQILTRFKIVDLNQKVEELSGGQLKRVALAHVLMTEPDLLILDEPTNHLDLDMIEWLEDYLSRNAITLLMVTHDRYFLDRVCNGILEIDNRQLYFYKGNYNYYLEKRQERTEAQNAESERANNLFRKELDWMRRQPQARGVKAKYRIDAFHHLEEKIQQHRSRDNVRLDVKASYMGNKIFEAQNVSKRFGDLCITEDFNYTFSRYEKMGIIGSNGTGKTTFIKMLTGEEQPDKGVFEIGETVTFGYYSQNGLLFDGNIKVIDIVRNIAEIIDLGNGRKLTASQFLQHFLFPPEKQQDYVGKLSGGEKRRLYLCSVLMKNPNFLVLDEPTNDLDIITLNVLEEYLAGFKGCVIVVSHDRYFMDRIVDHLLVFKGQGEIKDFPGNYTQYRETVKNTINVKQHPVQKEPQPIGREPVRRDTQKLSFNEKRELSALEKEIPALEAEQAQLERELSSGNLSNDELLQKSRRIGLIMQELDEKAMRWMELSETGKHKIN